MLKHSPTFGVQLENIPTINLRNEFVVHLNRAGILEGSIP